MFMKAHLPSRVAPLSRRLQSLAARFDGQPLREPFNFGVPRNPLRRYDFKGLAERLESLFPSSLTAAPNLSEEAFGMRRPGIEPACSQEEEEEEELCCRICHLTADESGEPLIEPCSCNGTIRYAHSSCLIDWMRHTGATAQRQWCCDLCLDTFRVRTALAGEPPGKKLLRRSLLEFVDTQMSSECSGWVAVLLTSISQTIVCCLCMAFANMLYLVANVLLMPLPDVLSAYLIWPMALPAMLIDLASIILYAMLALMKVSLFLSSGWRFVTGLPIGITNDKCKEVFSQYGTVTDANVLPVPSSEWLG
ncbi:E3 ubiquitin-protein ligase MARCH1 [Symbiodinium microadriaticum]|uniref:E3 ubiquitin-protein ligase MARCH1 n=1 Tax=Symbiodinium microadriaticum TaxID=2951 RepID=A0A1Q9DZ85_SYMMI|nr:E3 ubiquitin-protein ligase MARCH1 [Symbiodinium microadriaticum]